MWNISSILHYLNFILTEQRKPREKIHPAKVIFPRLSRMLPVSVMIMVLHRVVRRLIDWLIEFDFSMRDELPFMMRLQQLEQLVLKYWNKLFNFDMLAKASVIRQCDRKLIQYRKTAEQCWHVILSWKATP